MSALADQRCVPCKPGTPPLTGAVADGLLAQLKEWHIVEGRRLDKRFKFPDFVTALAFVNRVGALAEEQGHHPDILLTWGKVEIGLWTHSIGGLSESDFVLAAKIDRLSH
ncbi:MAG: 4a-hydroxytetrahydrobiopterin dehydratase [Phycisphaerae bacterium]